MIIILSDLVKLEPARGSMVGAEVGPQMSVPIQCLAVDRVLRLVELEIPDNVLAQDKTIRNSVDRHAESS